MQPAQGRLKRPGKCHWATTGVIPGESKSQSDNGPGIATPKTKAIANAITGLHHPPPKSRDSNIPPTRKRNDRRRDGQRRDDRPIDRLDDRHSDRRNDDSRYRRNSRPRSRRREFPTPKNIPTPRHGCYAAGSGVFPSETAYDHPCYHRASIIAPDGRIRIAQLKAEIESTIGMRPVFVATIANDIRRPNWEAY